MIIVNENIMNIKTLFLLSMLINTPINSMKRQLENPNNLDNNKKQKLNNIPSSLTTFFASNEQLKKAWRTIAQNTKKNDLPYDNNKDYTAKKIVANTPLDIKKAIAQQSIFFNEEWWYTTNKRLYKDTPYGISFLDDNTCIVGLYNGIIEIIDLDTNKPLLSFNTHKPILSLARNAKKNILACGFNNNSIELFKINKTNVSYELEKLSEFPTQSSVWAIAFTSTDNIIIGQEDGKIICLSQIGKKLFSQKTNHRVYGLVADTHEQSFTYGLITGNLSTSDQQTNNTTPLSHPIERLTSLFSLASSYNEKKYAIGTDNGAIYFINTKNSSFLKSFNLHAPAYSLSFNDAGNHLVAGLNDHTVHLLKHYVSPTPDQIMLRKAIQLWLQVKKPHRTIDSAESLLYIVSYQFKLNYEELLHTWKTFPKEMRNTIWLNVRRIINRYGKRELPIKDFCDINNLSKIKLRKTPSLEKYETTKESLDRHNQIRRILHFWRISHPKTLTTVNSLDSLLTMVSIMFNIRKTTLINIWNTFPEKTRDELINHYIPLQK